MATELDFRFWFDQSVASQLKFRSFVEYLSLNNSPFTGFHSLYVHHKAPGTCELFIEKPDVSLLGEVLSKFQSEDYRFTIYANFKCWRFEGISSERKNVSVAVSVWGRDYGRVLGFNNETEGDAQISFLSVGPFCKVDSSDDSSNDINEKVRENNHSVIDFIVDFISHENFIKVFAFTDAGVYCPHNSHLAFFSSKKILCSEVNKYRAYLKLQKTKEKIDNYDTDFYHRWRSQEQIKVLNLLINLNSQIEIHSEADFIDELIKRKGFDIYFIGDGIMILVEPYFINNFIEGLFLETR